MRLAHDAHVMPPISSSTRAPATGVPRRSARRRPSDAHRLVSGLVDGGEHIGVAGGVVAVITRRPLAALTSMRSTPASLATSPRTDASQCPQLMPVTWYSLVAMVIAFRFDTPRG